MIFRTSIQIQNYITRHSNETLASFRTVANICSTMCSKAFRRSVTSKTSPSDRVIGALKEAMKLASDQTLEIPAGLQAVVTHLTSPQK